MTEFTQKETKPNGFKRAGYASLTVLILASLGTSVYNVQQTANMQKDVTNIQLKQDKDNKHIQKQIDDMGVKLSNVEKTATQASKDATRAMQDNARQEESIDTLSK